MEAAENMFRAETAAAHDLHVALRKLEVKHPLLSGIWKASLEALTKYGHVQLV